MRRRSIARSTAPPRPCGAAGDALPQTTTRRQQRSRPRCGQRRSIARSTARHGHAVPPVMPCPKPPPGVSNGPGRDAAPATIRRLISSRQRLHSAPPVMPCRRPHLAGSDGPPCGTSVISPRHRQFAPPVMRCRRRRLAVSNGRMRCRQRSFASRRANPNPRRQSRRAGKQHPTARNAPGRDAAQATIHHRSTPRRYRAGRDIPSSAMLRPAVYAAPAPIHRAPYATPPAIPS